MESSLARRITSLVSILVLALVVTGPARANHETINVDGDLTDLISVINNNLGATGGGFSATSPLGNVYSSKCQFVNGYDVRNFYLFADFKNATGGAAATTRLYAGWDVFGMIGDVDGDGIPDAIGGLGTDPCALSDGPTGVAIGPFESYRILVDLNCDFTEEFAIVVKNDGIEIQLPGGATPPPQDPNFPDMIARSGNFLEIQVGRLEQMFPGIDLCNAAFVMSANAEQDGLGEDFGFMGQLEIPPSVAITKMPLKHTVPSGQANAMVSWTIVVTNDGSCNLSNLRVDDVLDAGMTFVSSVPPRNAGGTTQNSTWDFSNVARGDSRTITLNAQVTGQCTGGPFFNNATATGTHTPGAACGLPVRTATANVSAEVNCTVVEPPPCSITGPPANCLGEPLQLCGPDEPAGRDFSYHWTAPDGAMTMTDTKCQTFAVPLSGVYSLVVRDVNTGQETGPCTHVFKVNKLPFCFIAAPETACEGDHVQICGPQGNVSLLWTLPGGGTSTAQCIDLNPVTPANAGTYTLVVTDNVTGCKSAPCTATLVVNAKPACSITSTVPNPVPAGANVDLCGPTGANLTYAWTLPNGSMETGRCVSIVNAQAANAGLYTLVVTNSVTGCSSAPCTYNLLFEPQMIPCSITGGGKYVEGNTIELCGPIGAFTYLWTRPNGSTQAGRCLTVGPLTELDEGTYTLTVTGGGNSVSCSAIVTVNPDEKCENCPRTADWWEGECEDKDKDDSKFTLVQLGEIAQCVDDLSDFFNFGGPGNPVIPPPTAGSEWKYNDQGVDMGTAWCQVGYSDASWSSGRGVLGYGESYITTTVSYGSSSSNKHPTTYFRYTFTLNAASSVTGMTLRLMYDDGACVYLNGVEVTRKSLRSGPPSYDSWAYNHEANNSYETINLGSFRNLLQDGPNVLAVEVHQSEPSSSDLVFDAELQLSGLAPQAMTAGWPTDGGVLGDDDEEGDGFCAILTDDSKNDRSEAKRQFAALLANVCASGIPGKKGNNICLNLDTPIDCKNFDATTIAELIDEIDALLALLEGQSLHEDEVEDAYEDIIECLEDINNGWSIDVPKKCEEDDDDDDKKGRMTPSGDHVVVELGPMATVVFAQVAFEGTTYLELSGGWVLPQGLMAVDGKACVITSTATYSGDIEVSLRYDETLLQSPEEDLKLLRYDYGNHTWSEVAAVVDPVAHRISGPAVDLSAFVVATQWSVLSTDDRGRGLEFGIKQSFPNPTGGRTTIRYALTKSSPVHLSVHDIQGRQVALLESGTLSAGQHTAVWNGRKADGSKMPAGIYMIRLQSAEGMRTSKLVMMN